MPGPRLIDDDGGVRFVNSLRPAVFLLAFLLFASATTAATAGTIPSELLHEYPVPGSPQSLAAGQGGSVWFALEHSIGHLDQAGTVQEVQIPTGTGMNRPKESKPGTLALGPDGNVWFTDWGENSAHEHFIGRVTPDGKVTEFRIEGSYVFTVLSDIAGGSNAVWFVATVGEELPEEPLYTEFDVVICEVQMNGHIRQIKTRVDEETQPMWVGGVAVGPTGDVWFSYEEFTFEEPFATGLARYSPSDGNVELYEGQVVETMGPITMGGDGNAWVRIGPSLMRVTPSGEQLTPTALPQGAQGHPALAADGALWLGVEDGSLARVGQSGRFETFSNASFGGYFGAVTADTAGGLWYTTHLGGLMHFAVPSPPVVQDGPVITGNLVEGSMVSVSTGSWLHDPTEFAYQWERCGPAGDQCIPLSGETAGTHLIAPADVDHTLRAVVTATNLAGTAQATSFATGVLVAAAAIPEGQTPPAAVSSFPTLSPGSTSAPAPRPSRLKAKLRWEVEYSKRFTRFVELALRNAPTSGVARIRCDGGGCPFAKRTLELGAKRIPCRLVACLRRRLAVRNVYDVTKLFSHSRLSPGARLTITITSPGSLGKAFRVLTRSNREPTETIRCLAPGSVDKVVPCT
jgi:streptogramin lyase